MESIETKKKKEMLLFNMIKFAFGIFFKLFFFFLQANIEENILKTYLPPENMHNSVCFGKLTSVDLVKRLDIHEIQRN